MALNTDPVFLAAVKTGNVSIATANAGRDGSGAVGTLWSAAGANGEIVEHIHIHFTVTTTVGMVRVFRDTGAGTAASRFLIKEFVVPAITVGANVAGHSDDWWPNLKLASGELLVVSTENAENCDVTAEGGSLAA